MSNPTNLNVWDACQAAKAAGCRHHDITISYWPASYPSDGGWVLERSGQPKPKHFPGSKAHEKGLDAVKDYTRRMFGIREWVKIPGFGGTYFPVENVPAIKAAIKEAIKAAKTV